MVALTIDDEFAALCRPLQPEELSLLEQDILEHGCLDPIIIWENHDNIILDGHNRYRICTEDGIGFKVRGNRSIASLCCSAASPSSALTASPAALNSPTTAKSSSVVFRPRSRTCGLLTTTRKALRTRTAIPKWSLTMQLNLFTTECHRGDKLDRIGVPDLTMYIESDKQYPPIAEYVLERRFSSVVWSEAAKVRALRNVAPMEVEE